MKRVEIGEWVSGPFLDATIEGFIIEEDCSTYSVLISAINSPQNPHPTLTVKSSLKIQKTIIENFFRTMNREQQENLIDLAFKLDQFPWATDMTFKFLPFAANSKQSGDQNTIVICSNVLNKTLTITEENQRALYSFYLETVEKGLSACINSPEEIDCTDVFDTVITAIVLIGEDVQGINYLKNIVNTQRVESV